MNIQHYKQRLLDLEKTLSVRIGQETAHGRGEFIDSAHDVGDASVADEVASEEFTEAEHNAEVLQQVRDALGRVADGTFGTRLVVFRSAGTSLRGGDLWLEDAELDWEAAAPY